ncbi:[protein-PII] uridylyltransferase [Cumulibacter manganitolerans]|uniref:[protein-PII] uridylyltransferase n=1 Tax=Cumulibacter manganitolerans TaxID=1884992 RepID=UPI00225DD542|nr:[protein-PII] uridylyltransferase [Cumulibacter manganitolerans]
MVGPELRARLTSLYDRWLASLLPADQPIALVAVGGLGRQEPAPYSDLDLVLLHDLPARRVREVADSIWYPIWDAGLGLDHSVRTVDETAKLAGSDVKVSLGLLDVRFIAGDAGLAGEARQRIASAWRVNAATRAEQLQQMALERAEGFGHVAYLLQPNLKQAYGGLRDAMILRALARAQLIDIRPAVRDALGTLLDVRGEVQRHARKANDVLLAQDRAAIAASLGMSDGTTLLREVNYAGRTITHAIDTAFRRAASRRAEASSGGLRARLRRPSRVGPVREGLAKDVVTHAGEVVLARDAKPALDSGLLLRVARAAAYADLPISSFTLDRLRIESPADLPLWTDEMRTDFVALLAAGPPLLRVWESLDQHGLLVRLLPEWEHVRSLAQHNAVHTFTVDRHLLQTAIEVGAASAVSRPDLLRVGALLHDIGKGRPGDHSEVGATIAREIAQRMGFPESDCELIDRLVRYHLLLPDRAQRRDLTDPRTVQSVIEKVGSAPLVVELLQALSLADARATGPAAHSQWKTDLIGELVTRVKAAQAGEPIDELDLVDELATDLLTADPLEPFAVTIGRAPGAYQRTAVVLRDGSVSAAQVAGVLSASSLNIRRARFSDIDGSRLLDFIVEPRFGSMPRAEEISESVRRVYDGSLDVRERLARKAAAYDKPVNPDLYLRWVDNAATSASVLEVQAADRTALLFHLMGAFDAAGVQVRSAVIESYGPSVVDSFYLQSTRGEPLGREDKRAVEIELERLGEQTGPR